MTVRIQNRQRTISIRSARFKQQLQHVLAYLGYADYELSVVFAGDRFMRTLNRTYRNHDRPTNVLAFPQRSPEPGGADTPLLGDVVVALPTAAREAQAVGQPLDEYVLYLLVHGVLHLVGYDHEGSDEARRQMEACEQDILRFLRA